MICGHFLTQSGGNSTVAWRCRDRRMLHDAIFVDLPRSLDAMCSSMTTGPVVWGLQYRPESSSRAMQHEAIVLRTRHSRMG